MYVDDGIHIEETDQCFTCVHHHKDDLCPLLEALAVGVVELTGDMTVGDCAFYKEFRKHLKIVK